jgi:hypothetical protein
VGFLALELDILHDNFVSHITRTGRKVSTCPDVPAPECPAERLELGKHLPRTLALDALHEPTDGQVRRNRYEDVNMVLRNMPFQNLHILGTTYLPYQFSGTLGRFTAQNTFAIFRNPHEMIFQIVGGMAGLAIMLHAQNILKSSPKGEGFSPIPRRGH